MLEVTDVCALTSVWVAVLQAALEAVIRANARQRSACAHRGDRHGPPGGGELGYGSDADVMFVCEPLGDVEESRAVRWAVSIAEQVRTLLGTRASTRRWRSTRSATRGPQRSTGAHAGVVRGLLHAMGAAVEIQALRAHRVAGDEDLGQRFLLMADKTRYPPGGVSPEAVREIRRWPVDAERLPWRTPTPTPSWAAVARRHRMDGAVAAVAARAQDPRAALHVDSGDAECDRGGRADRRGRRRPAAAGLADRDPGPQRVGPGARQADRSAARPGRQLNAVALAAGWGSDDGGEFLDNYLRVTRRRKRWYERCSEPEHELTFDVISAEEHDRQLISSTPSSAPRRSSKSQGQQTSSATTGSAYPTT